MSEQPKMGVGPILAIFGIVAIVAFMFLFWPRTGPNGEPEPSPAMTAVIAVDVFVFDGKSLRAVLNQLEGQPRTPQTPTGPPVSAESVAQVVIIAACLVALAAAIFSGLY